MPMSLELAKKDGKGVIKTFSAAKTAQKEWWEIFEKKGGTHTVTRDRSSFPY